MPRRLGARRPGNRDRLRAAALVAAGAGDRARGALPAGLVDGAAPGRGHGRRDRDRHRRGAQRRSTRCRGSPTSRPALRRGVPIELAAVALASLPFIVEWRFGILGTGLNPDMSQHLFAVDRLADGGSERLISSGYPLGPHSIVAAIAALWAEHGAGLRRADARGRRLGLPGGAGAARAPGAVAAGRRGAAASASPTWSPRTSPRARSRRRSRRCSCSPSPSGSRSWSATSPLAGRRRARAAARGAARRARDRQRSTPTASRACSGSPGRSRVWAAVELGALWRRGGFANARLRARLAAPTALVARRLVLVGGAAGARADRRLRALRDLRPGGCGAREPVQPPLAARGARDLALGRLPGRARRRRGPGARLLPRRGARRGGARLRPALVVAARRARRPGGARRRGVRCGSTRSSPAPPTRRRRRSSWSPRW